MAKLVRDALPECKVFVRGNLVQVGKDEVLRCVVEAADKDIVAQFYPKAAAKLGLDTTAMKKAFDEGSVKSVAEGDWVCL